MYILGKFILSCAKILQYLNVVSAIEKMFKIQLFNIIIRITSQS